MFLLKRNNTDVARISLKSVKSLCRNKKVSGKKSKGINSDNINIPNVFLSGK